MFFLSLFILGFTSLVAQIVMTRELIVSFYGNEFFIGWFLFGWLFWVGIGSLIIKFLSKPIRGLPLLLICHLSVPLLLPLTIFWARLSRSLAANAVGQIPDLMPALMVSFLVMSPLCLIFGIQFTAASEYRRGRNAYFYEALGFVLGGLVFSYVLVLLNEFETSAILIFLNFAVVLILLFFEKVAGKRYFFMAAMAAVCLGLMCFLFSQQLNFCSAALRFPKEQLVETKNSIYGNLATTRTGHQLNFYESGLGIGTDKDEAFNEYLVHFPMLSDADPQKVLLIGAGFNGALQEILKYVPKQVFYAELDPSIIDLARGHIPALRQILEGGRVHLIKGDPRSSLKELPTDLDVIIINLPNPSTGLINRYFTDDFFKEVRKHLKPNGVMVTHLVFASDSISGPLGDLGTCLYKTIQRNFSSVVILPEDILFILASPGPLTHDPQVLIHRLKARGIHNYFVTDPAIVYRYTTDRIAKTLDVFKSNQTARINFDLHPRGYLYNLIYWLGIFHQDLSPVFSSVIRTNYFFVLALGIFLIFLLPFLCRSSVLDKSLLILAMSIGGFSLMSAEVIVIYGFQVFYGNLYYKIAWIISAFMAATAAGAFWGNKCQKSRLCVGADLVSSRENGPTTSDSGRYETRQARPLRSIWTVMKLHACIGGYFVIWLLLMWFAAAFKGLLAPELWIIGGAGIGMLVGWEFSYINNLFLTGQKQKDQLQLGTIYAADLLGSCGGALAVSIFLIPVYGVYKTLLFLMSINFTLAVVLFIHRQIKLR